MRLREQPHPLSFCKLGLPIIVGGITYEGRIKGFNIASEDSKRDEREKVEREGGRTHIYIILYYCSAT